MNTDSVSWVSLGLSALLILDKFLTKNTIKKCKCCGACIEFETASSPKGNKPPEIETTSL